MVSKTWGGGGGEYIGYKMHASFLCTDFVRNTFLFDKQHSAIYA
jgi:hypothetical protein